MTVSAAQTPPRYVIEISFTDIFADRRILREVQTLKNLGFKIVHICKTDQSDPNTLKIPGIFVFPFFLLRFLNWLRRLENIDIVVAHDVWALPLGFTARMITGAELIYNSHELAITEPRNNFLWQFIRQKLAYFIEWIFINRARHVITVSTGIASEFEKVYQLSNSPIVIRNVPDMYIPVCRPNSSNENSKLRLVFCGNISERRGIENTIHALALTKRPVSLTLLGKASNRYRKTLQRLAKRIGVEENLVFKAPVPYEQVVDELSKYDIGVYCPSGSSSHLINSLPNKVFEYMHAGIALLVSDYPCLRDVIHSAGNGILIQDGLAHNISDAIDELSNQQMESFKKASSKSAADFSWNVEKRKLMDLVEGLAG